MGWGVGKESLSKANAKTSNKVRNGLGVGERSPLARVMLRLAPM